MKIKEPSKSEGLRLTVRQWQKMRDLMSWHCGRAWLEKIIDREHRKVFGSK